MFKICCPRIDNNPPNLSTTIITAHSSVCTRSVSPISPVAVYLIIYLTERVPSNHCSWKGDEKGRSERGFMMGRGWYRMVVKSVQRLEFTCLSLRGNWDKFGKIGVVRNNGTGIVTRHLRVIVKYGSYSVLFLRVDINFSI